jgi:hypothetical protein
VSESKNSSNELLLSAKLDMIYFDCFLKGRDWLFDNILFRNYLGVTHKK